MNILISNDDGIDSAGIQSLAKTLSSDLTDYKVLDSLKEIAVLKV